MDHVELLKYHVARTKAPKYTSTKVARGPCVRRPIKVSRRKVQGLLTVADPEQVDPAIRNFKSR